MALCQMKTDQEMFDRFQKVDKTIKITFVIAPLNAFIEWSIRHNENINNQPTNNISTTVSSTGIIKQTQLQTKSINNHSRNTEEEKNYFNWRSPNYQFVHFSH